MGDRGYRAARLAALIGGLSVFVLMNAENRLGIVIAVAVFVTLMIRPEPDVEKRISARLLGRNPGRRAGGRWRRFALYAALIGGLLFVLMFVLVSIHDRFGTLIAIAMMLMVMFGIPLLLVGTLLWAVCYRFIGSPPGQSPPAASNADGPPRQR